MEGGCSSDVFIFLLIKAKNKNLNSSVYEWRRHKINVLFWEIFFICTFICRNCSVKTEHDSFPHAKNFINHERIFFWCCVTNKTSHRKVFRCHKSDEKAKPDDDDISRVLLVYERNVKSQIFTIMCKE